MVSPRTRNVPRVKARSLRVYWISTNWRSSWSRSISVADLEPDHPVDVLLRRAEAVDAGHRRDHDHVAAGEQAVGRRVPQPLDLVVDRRVLLDVGVRLRDVRLGLVVVVVGDEVLDRVVGQQLAELVGQLGGQRLVRRHHQRRAAAAARPARRWSPTCRCRWRRAARRSCSPARIRRSSSSMAAGWSPEGWKSLTTWKGATRRSRSVVGLTATNRTSGRTGSSEPLALPSRSARRRPERRRPGTAGPARSPSLSMTTSADGQALLPGRPARRSGPGRRASVIPRASVSRASWMSSARVDDDHHVVRRLEAASRPAAGRRRPRRHRRSAAAVSSALRRPTYGMDDRLERCPPLRRRRRRRGRAGPGPASRPAASTSAAELRHHRRQPGRPGRDRLAGPGRRRRRPPRRARPAAARPRYLPEPMPPVSRPTPSSDRPHRSRRATAPSSPIGRATSLERAAPDQPYATRSPGRERRRRAATTAPVRSSTQERAAVGPQRQDVQRVQRQRHRPGGCDREQRPHAPRPVSSRQTPSTAIALPAVPTRSKVVPLCGAATSSQLRVSRRRHAEQAARPGLGPPGPGRSPVPTSTARPARRRSSSRADSSRAPTAATAPHGHQRRAATRGLPQRAAGRPPGPTSRYVVQVSTG